MSDRTRRASRAMLKHALACHLESIVIVVDPFQPPLPGGGLAVELGSSMSHKGAILALEQVLARLKAAGPDAVEPRQVGLALDATDDPNGKPS